MKETGADRLAPAGRERERERARERGTAADRRVPPVRQRGRTAWLGRARLVWAADHRSYSISGTH
jgi:hypothetical protein